jgi:hypothetical protein
MGIFWISDSATFNIALANLNFKSNKNYEIKWKFQKTDIKNFKESCQSNELQRFEQALLLIQHEVIFDMYVSILYFI